MLVLVLGWTQCFPQGVGAPPAMLRGRTAGFPKKLGGRASGEAGYVDTICTAFPRTVPPTVAHQPRAGCIRLVHCLSSSILFKYYEYTVGHLFVLSWARVRRVALGSVVSES